MDHFVPIGPLHSHHELIPGDAGIVYQNVNLSKGFDGALDRILNVFFVTYIYAKDLGLTSSRGDLIGDPGQLLFIAGRQRNARAILRQGNRTGPPNPL